MNLWWVLVSDKSELREAKVTDAAPANRKKRKYTLYEIFEVLLEPPDTAHGNSIPSAAFHPKTGPLLCRVS